MNTCDHPPEDGDPPQLQKGCLFCGKFFPKIRRHQKVCLDPVCQKKRKRSQERRWIENYRKEEGLSYFQGDYDRVREWRKKNPEYQRRWRAKKRREIHNAVGPANPIQSLRLHLRFPVPLCEIQTLTVRLIRSGTDFWVNGGGMQDTNADGQAAPP